jgi:hypothetical protein
MTAVGQFTIIYNGDGGMLTETLTTCTDCRGWYDSTSGYGVLWLEFENSAGAPHTTLVNVQVNPFLNGEYWVGVNFLEDNPSFPFAYQGNYYFSNGATAMLNTSGMCLATTKIDLSDGGGVAGSLDCMFRGGQSTNQQTAELRGTFSSMFPN